MQRIAILSLLLGFTITADAAPALQMHVFEQNDEDVAPVLQTHVYTGQNQYQTSKYPSQTATTNPSLAYEKASIYLRGGYRQDKLFWNIGTNGGFPNIISELKWENIEIATLNFGASYALDQHWLLNIDAVYGRIFDGDNQDSDYFGNNRTFEFSRSNNGADEGDVYDISVSTAYKIPLNKYLEFQPEIGFSYHAQNFKMVDGKQTVSNYGFPVPVGSFAGLNSTYDATWFGPWLGWNTIISPTNKFSFNVGVEYHYVSYDATANWNLRGDFAHPESFTNETNAYGLIGEFGGIYRYSPSLTFDFALNYQHWQSTEAGKIKFFLADGRTGTQPFHEVKWRSYGVNLGLNYDF